MSFRKFYPIFRDSIKGLTFLHSRSIVHRDIKPANIMCLNDDEYVLADYGEGKNLSHECLYQDYRTFS